MDQCEPKLVLVCKANWHVIKSEGLKVALCIFQTSFWLGLQMNLSLRQLTHSIVTRLACIAARMMDHKGFANTTVSLYLDNSFIKIEHVFGTESMTIYMCLAFLRFVSNGARVVWPRIVWPGQFGHGHFGQDFRLGRTVWPNPYNYRPVGNYSGEVGR